MRGSRVLALFAAACVLSACTATPNSSTSSVTAESGTVPPAYPVGERLSPGIEVIDRIPVGELTTSGTAGLDENDPCKGLPPGVVAGTGLDAPPARSSRRGCYWTGPGGLLVQVSGYPPRSMAQEVEDHLRNTRPGGTDVLAHLAWLRIDGHYAIERILATDPASTCAVTVDLAAPASVFILTLRGDDTGPARVDRQTAIDDYCPVSRKVAQNLLRHFDSAPPGSTSTGVLPWPPPFG